MTDYKALFLGLYKAVADCEAPKGTQVDDVLGDYQAHWNAAGGLQALNQNSTSWTIEVDDAGLKHIKCPHCGGLDTIVEVDCAIRFNDLELNGESYLSGSSAGSADDVIARMGEEGDWDFDHWLCESCCADNLQAPAGFKIEEWV